MRTPIHAEQVPPPKGPYSQAIVAAGPTVYISGQLPASAGSFAEQAEQVFTQIDHLLRAAGSAWSRVVKLTVVLADLRDYAELGEVSRRWLVEPYPARTTLQSALPPGVGLEVDCTALVGTDP